MRTRLLIPIMVASLALIVLLAPTQILADDDDSDDGGQTKVVEVNCADGDSINEALEDEAEELIVEISGICDEDVLIERDNVTLIGTDPATDGIRGVGPNPPASAVVHVENAKFVRFENLSIRDGARDGVCIRNGFVVELVNSQIVNHGRNGLRTFGGIFIFLTDVSITGNPTFSLSGSNTDAIRCLRCTISDGLGGALAFGGSISLTDSSIDATVGGVQSGGGGHAVVNLDGTTVTSPVVAFLAVRGGQVFFSDSSFSGGLFIDNKGTVVLENGVQSAIGAGNSVEFESTVRLIGLSSLLGPVPLTGFSKAWIEGSSSVNGDLVCGSGSDAFCDDPTVNLPLGGSTSNCGQCPKP